MGKDSKAEIVPRPCAAPLIIMRKTQNPIPEGKTAAAVDIYWLYYVQDISAGIFAHLCMNGALPFIGQWENSGTQIETSVGGLFFHQHYMEVAEDKKNK